MKNEYKDDLIWSPYEGYTDQQSEAGESIINLFEKIMKTSGPTNFSLPTENGQLSQLVMSKISDLASIHVFQWTDCLKH